MNKTTTSQQKNTDEFHSHCVCQICTCHKHKCPHSKLSVPFNQISSYQKQYTKHPLNPSKPFSQKSQYDYKPYGYVNSSYKEDYPGHKPQLREKIIPRVKNQDRNIPFDGQSWYKSTYTPKSVAKDPRRNKDRQYNPINQPFEGATTYKTDFYPKRANSQMKKTPVECNFPDGYKFDGSTTYKNDFIEKGLPQQQSFKPIDRVPPKGEHYLSTTYGDDYTQKQTSSICPVHLLPAYPKQIDYPAQHVSFNKYNKKWVVK